MQKFVITTLPEYPKRQFLFQVKDGRVMQICAVRSAGQQLLGNIYIGKIQKLILPVCIRMRTRCIC